MTTRQSHLQKVALIASAVIAPFFFLSSTMKPWRGDRVNSIVGQEIIHPAMSTWHGMSTYLASVWQSYIALSGAAEENHQLKEKVAILQTKLMDYEEQVRQTARLRQLLGLSELQPEKMLVAEVIGTRVNNLFKALRISRGSLDGVKAGMPVIAPEGIVGRVIRTGLKESDVQLLVDFDFNLDVLLQRTRVRGVLNGFSNDLCRLNLQKGADIRIGDTIITSGIVGGFPKGLPVGRVMRITYESDNVSQIITAEPWVDYRRLEEVMVLHQLDPELQKIVETAGREWLERTLKSGNG
ncbi:MAG: rod shape-determining protein MreC [Proteobacteria bacterium]|nr:rod shape-determining protein MreC [Pseudomonadota bacterium]